VSEERLKIVPALQGGPAPTRAPGEDFASFGLRLAAWSETPAGLAEKAAGEAKRAADIKRAAAEATARRMEAIGIPARYRFVGDPAAHLNETQAMAAVRAPGDIIVLSGHAGCGKTAAACWWLLQTPPRSREPMFVTAARLSRMSRFDEEAMDEIIRAGRLVIDDLAVEYADEKGFFKSLLDEVINARYSDALPTLITTNIDVKAFKLRYEERIVDRIRETGRFESLDNPSLRKRA
jgi:DNA replication protein DnaC